MRPNFLKTIERKQETLIDKFIQKNVIDKITLTVISIMILCVAVVICFQ